MTVEPKPIGPISSSGCAGAGFVLFGGFFLAGLVGMALAIAVVQGNGPAWMIPVVFFVPPGLFMIGWCVVVIPRAIRRAQEAQRSAPSPESLAAAAGGEGVEVGAKPDPTELADRDDLPTVFVVDTTPGTVLAHRLTRMGLAPGCQFGCAVCVALFWNGIVSVFVFQLVARWNRGGVFQWLETLFLVPFVLIGIVLIGAVMLAGLNWFVAGLVGGVEVELSTHPIAPGGRVQLHVAQRGLFPLGRVAALLVCTEEATYVAGTSKSTATRVVLRHPISNPDQGPETGGLPLEADFTVPSDAMHSFDAPNNEINWTIRVTGRVLGMLPFSCNYSLTVTSMETPGDD